MFLLGCLFYLPGSLFIQTIWFGWTDLESVNLYWIYSLIWMFSCIRDWIHCFILKKEKNLVFQGRNFRAFMMINCVLSFEYISDWIPQKQTMIMTKMNGTDQIERNKNAIEFWFPEISMSLMEGNFFLSFFFCFFFFVHRRKMLRIWNYFCISFGNSCREIGFAIPAVGDRLKAGACALSRSSPFDRSPLLNNFCFCFCCVAFCNKLLPERDTEKYDKCAALL